MKRTTQTHLPTMALVGRTNVGKSTLFNRLIEERKALTSDVSGTTRTRNIGICYWRGLPIRTIDTGGLTYEENLPFEKEVIEQAERAVKDADVILFVVDIQSGLLAQEQQLARRLHKLKKPVLLVGNKADSTKFRNRSLETNWSKFGFGFPLLVSAVNGSGTGDLLEAVYDALPKQYTQQKETLPVAADEPVVASVAVLGKPNVGKSSLLNAMAGSDEVIVSDVAHTTRETFDVNVLHEEKRFRVIDTAGIRRKSHVKGGLERMGVMASIHALDRADVVLLVLDATEPLSTQEKHLLGLIENKRAGVIIVLNKWDLVPEHSQENRTEFIDTIRRYYPFLNYAPVVFVSAKTGFRVHQLFGMIEQVANARKLKIDEQVLQGWWRTIVRKHKPARGKGTRHPSILEFAQRRTEPPTFELVIKYQTTLHESYLHFLENQLRESFGFEGTPLVLIVRKYKKL